MMVDEIRRPKAAALGSVVEEIAARPASTLLVVMNKRPHSARIRDASALVIVRPVTLRTMLCAGVLLLAYSNRERQSRLLEKTTVTVLAYAQIHV
jgi:hypothetical protein